MESSGSLSYLLRCCILHASLKTFLVIYFIHRTFQCTQIMANVFLRHIWYASLSSESKAWWIIWKFVRHLHVCTTRQYKFSASLDRSSKTAQSCVSPPKWFSNITLTEAIRSFQTLSTVSNRPFALFIGMTTQISWATLWYLLSITIADFCSCCSKSPESPFCFSPAF